jgi:hypothetical protein
VKEEQALSMVEHVEPALLPVLALPLPIEHSTNGESPLSCAKLKEE